jgi:hypothetical protein
VQLGIVRVCVRVHVHVDARDRIRVHVHVHVRGYACGPEIRYQFSPCVRLRFW